MSLPVLSTVASDGFHQPQLSHLKVGHGVVRGPLAMDPLREASWSLRFPIVKWGENRGDFPGL